MSTGFQHTPSEPAITCLKLIIETVGQGVKLATKTPERRQWCRSSVFIVNFEHILHLILVFPLLTLTR